MASITQKQFREQFRDLQDKVKKLEKKVLVLMLALVYLSQRVTGREIGETVSVLWSLRALVGF